MIPSLALVVGVVLGLVLEPTVPGALQPYLPIAVVAALDAVFGAIRAQLGSQLPLLAQLGDELASRPASPSRR